MGFMASIGKELRAESSKKHVQEAFKIRVKRCYNCNITFQADSVDQRFCCEACKVAFISK